MPLIRVGETVAHVRGPGLKVCSVAGCNFVAEYQCDYPTGPRRTCDRRLCERHAIARAWPLSGQLRLALEGSAGIPEEEAAHFCPAHDRDAAKH